jgi:SAM-dependent methyltransferase
MKLDVGCGLEVKDGFVGLDKVKYNSGVKYVVDLEKEKLPFKDNSVDEIWCCHVLEHLINPLDVIKEFHRVLKCGGKVVIQVPHFSSRNAKVPCHKNFWNLDSDRIISGYQESGLKWGSIEKVFRFGKSRSFWFVHSFIFDWVIKRFPVFYESNLYFFYPIDELEFVLIKGLK